MISTWTRQFIIATGLFALILTTITTNLFIKEQQVVKKQLEDSKTFQVSSKVKNKIQDKVI